MTMHLTYITTPLCQGSRPEILIITGPERAHTSNEWQGQLQDRRSGEERTTYLPPETAASESRFQYIFDCLDKDVDE